MALPKPSTVPSPWILLPSRTVLRFQTLSQTSHPSPISVLMWLPTSEPFRCQMPRRIAPQIRQTTACSSSQTHRHHHLTWDLICHHHLTLVPTCLRPNHEVRPARWRLNVPMVSVLTAIVATALAPALAWHAQARRPAEPMVLVSTSKPAALPTGIALQTQSMLAVRMGHATGLVPAAKETAHRFRAARVVARQHAPMALLALAARALHPSGGMVIMTALEIPGWRRPWRAQHLPATYRIPVIATIAIPLSYPGT